ncbi:hypothetical protein AV530_019276 [Patagioenas fasciata monilis]|uniref:Uncharacterized protein n=1 Tax=Patagioenas fasciata monilis TaxID=372326 RepID=A0A1V4JD39_PATFA|nr:hypothetical protein AV530_019276 [Patagioenas fasciata monilis]
MRPKESGPGVLLCHAIALREEEEEEEEEVRKGEGGGKRTRKSLDWSQTGSGSQQRGPWAPQDACVGLGDPSPQPPSVGAGDPGARARRREQHRSLGASSPASASLASGSSRWILASWDI